MTQQSVHETVAAWFGQKLPETWFAGAPSIDVDPDEILIVGELPKDGDIKAFRESTRDDRIGIALEAEDTFGRKVSWGVRSGERTELFTTVSAPAMTRLRMAERKVLDTLVAGGVARSRSEALNWCVRLVGKHESAWLADLQEALKNVHKVRATGPEAR